MNRAERLGFGVLTVTAALFFLCGAIGIPAVWGLNHLTFLPASFTAIGLTLFVTASILLLFFNNRFESSAYVEQFAWRLIESRIWARAAIALACAGLFLAFSASTHFGGDGYLNLSILGRADTYVLKWSEPGAILMVRSLQAMMGEFTPESSLAAFRILSILSGAVVIFNAFVIARNLCNSPSTQILTLVTLLFSGSLLLWFGYVEHYPVFWAGATTFLALSIKSLKTGGGSLPAVVAFMITLFLHLQAIWMCLGLLFVFTFRGRSLGKPHSWSTKHMVLILSAISVFAVVVSVLSSENLKYGTIFLPFFEGRPTSPDYSVLSARHLLDICNEFLVVCPGFVALLWLGASRLLAPLTPQSKFLLLLTGGAALFLLLVDPVLGMGRDWDLYSFCVLPPSLLFIQLADKDRRTPSHSFVGLYTLVCVVISVSFVSANLAAPSSEARFETLLGYYGTKNRSGWGVAAQYYQDNGDLEGSRRVGAQVKQFFPEEAKLTEAYAALRRRDYPRAFALAKELVQVDRYRSDYLQILGNAFGKLGHFDSAVTYYSKAVSLRPNSPTLKNEYGQLYLNAGRYPEALRILKSARHDDPSLDFIAEGIGLAYLRMNQVDSGLAVADTLFSTDSHSPGGHLIRMLIAIQTGDMSLASQHLAAFRHYGMSRSDYQSILEYYSYLER